MKYLLDDKEFLKVAGLRAYLSHIRLAISILTPLIGYRLSLIPVAVASWDEGTWKQQMLACFCFHPTGKERSMDGKCNAVQGSPFFPQ